MKPTPWAFSWEPLFLVLAAVAAVAYARAARTERPSTVRVVVFALGLALNGADALDSFLAVTRHPAAKLAEWALVIALATHMALGLRVLAIEFLPWRDRTAATVSACLGAALMVGLLFLLNAA